MIQNRRFLFAGIMTLISLLAIPALVFAQAKEGLNLTTSPYLVNLVTKPGTTVTADIKVHNNANSSQKLKVGVMKFTASGELGKPQLAERQSGDDYFDWISFSDTSFTLASNEWKTIKATIKVPATAAFGYYYAVTFTQEGKATVSGQPAAAVSGSSAVLVLLDVKAPGEKPELSLLDFNADKSFYEFLPATFNIRVQNKGNIHVVPHGTIFIDLGNKHDLGLLTVNDAHGNVLPGSNRIFSTSWSDGFPVYEKKLDAQGKPITDSKGTPKKALKWDFNNLSKIRFGRYTAHLLLVYDNGTRDIPVEGTVSFWVVPVRLLLGALFIGLLVLVGLLSTMKSLWRKVFRKHS